ncbi:MAG: crossover junction endodeoxyribonuclease RuvC [Methanophagales archaeon]|nr:crossover junction endodeoxyribonuclease RuvC [Methanophagales archaeon]MCW3140836.1 crossover junction endodeoxyribonuclease RuvC [Methanophagales archaeon]
MRVIGIDPGTARTGWGVVEFNNGLLKLIDFGYIKTTPSQSKEERLKKIYEDLLAVIKSKMPDDMAIEKIFFNINVKTALSVGQARGVCLLAAAIADIPAYEYNTSEVKSIITGYGRATKDEVASRVKELLQLEETPKPNDITDALAIAATHIIQRGDFLEEDHQ